MTSRPRPHRIRRYVALLEPLPLRRVSRALTKQAFVVDGCTASELLEHLAGPQHVCAIIDPSMLSPDQIKRAIQLLVRPPRVVAVYAALTPGGVQGALDFARNTGATVLFQSPEDDPASLARAIIAIPEPSFVRRLLDGIRPRLSGLPPRLSSAIEELFVDDATLGTPKALARRASIARRSVDRWLDRVGIESPRLLVAVPAVLRAVTLLRETDMPLRRIAQLSGYASARRLRFHLLELTGLEPADIRIEDDPRVLVDRMVHRLLLEPGAAAIQPPRLRLERNKQPTEGPIVTSKANLRLGND